MGRVIGAVLVTVGLALAGCGGDGGGAPAGGETGVKECDEYVATFERCLPKLPEGAREALKKAVYAQREGFKQTAQTAEGKTSLVGTCTTALENLKKNPACQ
jgi:hypothetical protein